MQATTEGIIVPDALVEKLALLRLGYASFLSSYRKELENNPKAQEEFVNTVPELLRKDLSSDFNSCFRTFTNEDVSLFNITYLKHFCDKFPENVW